MTVGKSIADASLISDGDPGKLLAQPGAGESKFHPDTLIKPSDDVAGDMAQIRAALDLFEDLAAKGILTPKMADAIWHRITQLGIKLKNRVSLDTPTKKSSRPWGLGR